MLTIGVRLIGPCPCSGSGVQTGTGSALGGFLVRLPFFGANFSFSLLRNAEESFSIPFHVSPATMRSIEVARRSGALARVSYAREALNIPCD